MNHQLASNPFPKSSPNNIFKLYHTEQKTFSFMSVMHLIQTLIILISIYVVESQFNASTCGYIEINDLFYFINYQKNYENLK